MPPLFFTSVFFFPSFFSAYAAEPDLIHSPISEAAEAYCPVSGSDNTTAEWSSGIPDI
jgi:hypothetical protein